MFRTIGQIRHYCSENGYEFKEDKYDFTPPEISGSLSAKEPSETKYVRSSQGSSSSVGRSPGRQQGAEILEGMDFSSDSKGRQRDVAGEG